MYKYLLSALAVAASVIATPIEERTTTSTCSPVGISPSKASAIKAAFTSAKVVPDVVPSIDPKVDLYVAYGQKEVKLGNTFSAAETTQDPVFNFTTESDYDPSTTKYLFIIVDPDAPGPEDPFLRQFLHKIVYDISPSCMPNPATTTEGGTTFVMYAPLTPLSVASHRYTYLIYRQPPNFVVPPLQLAEATRAPFNLQQFVTEGNLTLVGGRFMREGLGTTVTTGPVKDAIQKAEAALANLKLTPSQRAALDKAIAAINKLLGI
ncbi:hypothetical protein LTS18_003962 [Coniosporium uncinatum]|uniref:Uncharacterized protein n=1 Tax=Coniosporium uncinatum TaxID=93489 RepID=A0ACC3DT00_9PEZI|nr:hypothetical protein LTS18_003962 [Coniosporium uncinatum]